MAYDGVRGETLSRRLPREDVHEGAQVAGRRPDLDAPRAQFIRKLSYSRDKPGMASQRKGEVRLQVLVEGIRVLPGRIRTSCLFPAPADARIRQEPADISASAKAREFEIAWTFRNPRACPYAWTKATEFLAGSDSQARSLIRVNTY
jgi:hypothetical protein